MRCLFDENHACLVVEIITTCVQLAFEFRWKHAGWGWTDRGWEGRADWNLKGTRCVVPAGGWENRWRVLAIQMSMDCRHCVRLVCRLCRMGWSLICDVIVTVTPRVSFIRMIRMWKCLWRNLKRNSWKMFQGRSWKNLGGSQQEYRVNISEPSTILQEFLWILSPVVM